MNQIRLYIENEEIELVEQIQFAINKQFEDINNPTSIINDYSKTINIPFSQHNNAVFGKIFSPDRLILGGLQSTVGMAFDPYRKLNFRLEWNEDILMQGYAKLLNVIMENGKGHYEVSLNGELGKLFQEFKKITFVYSADSSNYWIDYHDIFAETMDKDLIYTSWNTAGQSSLTLQKKYIWVLDPITQEIVKIPNPLYKFTDIMGFTPSNTYDDDFEYKTLQTSPTRTIDFKDFLDMINFEQRSGFSSETVVGDNGLLPRQVGEFRSYYQQPFIYFNKLFQIFQEKAEDISGYDFILDSSWFGNENPYWRLLAMTLNKIDVNKEKTSQTANNVYEMTTTMPLDRHPYYEEEMAYSVPVMEPYVQRQIISEDTSISCSFDVSLGERYFNMDPDSGGMVLTGVIPAGINIGVSSNPGDKNRIKKNNGMEIDVIVAYGQADSSNGIINASTATLRYWVVDTSTTLPTDSPNVTYIKMGELPGYQQGNNYNIELPFNIYIPSEKQGTPVERFKMCIQFRWLLNEFPIDNPLWIYTPIFCVGLSNMQIVNLKYVPRSHYKFTLSDLWDNEHTIFDVILRYCKMFRILIEVDHVHKKIYFRQQKKYFENYTVEDWTDKLDMSKQWKMTPIQWDAKYINFNYEDNDSKLGADYREKTGVNYGDYKLKTAYNFNDDTNDLFEKCYSPMINTDNVLSFKTLFQDLEIVYSFSDTEEFVYSKDDEGKYIQNFGTFYFYNGLKNFDTTPSLRFVATRISDDTDLQIATNTYCYQDGINERATDKYLALQNYAMRNWRNYLSLFNKPAAYYTKTNHFSNSVSIYEAIWKKYIEERYNIQNKLLIAYFNLSPRDFALFRFNKFVTINNQLYFVNKILDYNLTTKDSTKVELLTIQDPTAYYMNNF